MLLCWKEGMHQFSYNLQAYIHTNYFHNVAIHKKIVKIINNFWYQFFVVVPYLMLLMLGVQMAVMMTK